MILKVVTDMESESSFINTRVKVCSKIKTGSVLLMVCQMS